MFVYNFIKKETHVIVKYRNWKKNTQQKVYLTYFKLTTDLKNFNCTFGDIVSLFIFFIIIPTILLVKILSMSLSIHLTLPIKVFVKTSSILKTLILAYASIILPSNTTYASSLTLLIVIKSGCIIIINNTDYKLIVNFMLVRIFIGINYIFLIDSTLTIYLL